jgi:hypothetical protein
MIFGPSRRIGQKEKQTMVRTRWMWNARLLMLAVPPCAMLWAEGGLTRWLALLLTSAGIVLTADIPSLILTILTGNFHISAAGLSGHLLTALLMQPTPLILLAMAIFYLWVYVRYDPAGVTVGDQKLTN